GISRIVYEDGTGEHQVATLEDGMKYAGDDGQTDATKAIAKKLNNTVDIIGGAKGALTEENIGVNNVNGKLKVQLAKDLKDLNSTSYTTTTGEGDQATTSTTVVDGNGLKITGGPSITNNGVDAGNKAITNVGSGADASGKYTDETKTNAANVGDVQNIVNDAKNELTNGTNGLNSKANVDASNIGENMKDANGNKASDTEINKNKESWASAIGTNTVAKDNKQLVTSDAVATALEKKADKTYVDQELNKKADKTYVDEQLDTKANKSDVYTKDQTYSKSEVDSKVSDITTGLDGKAGKDLDNISDKGKTAIHNVAKDAVEVVDGMNTTVKKTEGTDTTPTKYAVNVEGKGKVASGDTGLISGDTLYKEVHVDKDGSYIKSSNTVAQNLSSLDTGLKTTSDLIHTNTAGDTIQIGGNSKATKIDVSGKDANGNTTGRVITGVITDASDRNSAANVGYVEANTQQIYREMNNAYGNLNRNINRAAAGSNALAALHPLDYDPADKASFAVGYGHYRNANAAAIGAFYYPNANTMVNVGVSVGNGDPGINAGVSFKLGQGSAYNGVSKAEMAQTIHDQAAEISTIKANDAAKDKRIDALEKENQEMKKQIQEILARLNG
ncbi:YadA-like family protein, partial [Megasphaera sp.]|uniref:YadA-like family protein n=1 Tax=Megasphaera sp. TaxID=2023260 RepID=UPI003AAC5170